MPLYFLSTVQELNTWGSDDWQKMQWSKNKYNGPASLYEDTAQIYQESKINLNIQRIYAQDGLSDRVFNIMMAGGFLLADRNESITELFEEEKHMALFSNRDEMNEKINFYLTNDSARKKIEEAGQKEVLAHHSCLNRIEHIIKRIQDKA
jgi:spore maturation protein CgeB